jgi:ABC-type branched-subunit amino acid transport system ATPase component
MLKAPILLLDEPAVGISTNNLHLIKQVLLKEKERGKILVIADHLPVWYDLADRILPMSELR